jgi:hypothetical protein
LDILVQPEVCMDGALRDRAGWSEGASSAGDDGVAPVSSTTGVRRPAAAPGIVAAVLVAFDGKSTASLQIGGETIEAAVDAAVDPAVLRTALARRERVIAQQEGDGWVVVGALRTAATPGVDEGDEFAIKARRVRIEAAHELSVVSGAASVVLRAYGQVETLAQDITSRASQVHKIIGRMIRLN